MSTSPALDTIVARMNSAYASRTGFVIARVHSYDPAIVAIECRDNATATMFLFEEQLAGFAGKMAIDPPNSSTILQYRE